MKLTVIGCTGSFAGPDSPASCYLLTGRDAAGRDWRVLLDMGSGAMGNLQRHIGLEQLDGIFVSHLHPDHCIDLAGLHIALRWDPRGRREEPIPMWAPEDTHAYLARVHGIPLEPGLSESFGFRPWAEHPVARLGPFTVSAFPALHPAAEPYCMRIRCEEPGTTTVLTYSGDTDDCPGLREAAAGSDVFLCEAAYHEGRDDRLRGIHLTGRRAGAVAQDAGARRLMLTHLPIWNDPVLAVEEALGVYDGPVHVVEGDRTYDFAAPAD